ncbi:MAG TPA: lysophospholipid acyltransferase family protein [Geminicoccaceae bacterium]|nr:lysophospholipid acyltransferase family protein [Geminicoccaceae bacterium]
MRLALWRLEAGLLWSVWAASSVLGPERASALGRRAMQWLGPRLRHHPKLLRNLQAAFPDWPAERIAAVARDAWGQVGRVITEYPHLVAISDAPERLELVSHVDIRPMVSGERPAIFVAAHLANWELSVASARRADVPLTGIYSPQQNPVIHDMLQRRRAALGCRLLPKRSSVHALVAELKAGRSIGVLMDQRYDEGDTVPFFDRPAPVALAPAMLAARLGLPLIPVRIERLEGTRFRVTLFEAIEPDPARGGTREIARDMTARVYARFEAWIRERPEQWLCIKHRWPNVRKKKWQVKIAKNPRLGRGLPRPTAAAGKLGRVRPSP